MEDAGVFDRTWGHVRWPENLAALQALLDMPSYMASAAVLPLGRPIRQLTKLKREPVESFATIDSADGPPLRT